MNFADRMARRRAGPIDEIRQLAARGMSQRGIGRVLGMSQESVARRCKWHGITVATQRRNDESMVDRVRELAGKGLSSGEL